MFRENAKALIFQSATPEIIRLIPATAPDYVTCNCIDQECLSTCRCSNDPVPKLSNVPVRVDRSELQKHLDRAGFRDPSQPTENLFFLI